MGTGKGRGPLRGGYIAVLAAVIATASPLSTWAQAGASREIAVLQGRQLVFGSLIPGFPEPVSVNDASRRAELVIEGSGTVEVRLMLPEHLASRKGGRIPLQFAPGDAAVLHPGSVEAVRFDPRQPLSISLDPDRGPTRILVGGTAHPSENQSGGTYTTAIAVTVLVHTSN